jgi:hypothetical protein
MGIVDTVDTVDTTKLTPQRLYVEINSELWISPVVLVTGGKLQRLLEWTVGGLAVFPRLPRCQLNSGNLIP